MRKLVCIVAAFGYNYLLRTRHSSLLRLPLLFSYASFYLAGHSVSSEITGFNDSVEMAVFSDETTSSRTALVLYGTETGTSQDLAFETSRILERLHFVTDVEELDNVQVQGITQYALVVFVIATTGQGDFPANARKFWKVLLLKRLTSTFLLGLDYVLLGLGDSSYPKFNLAARKLHKRLGQLGATSLLQPCEADEQGEDSTDGAFLAWSQILRSQLLEQYPLPGDLEPISDSDPLQSKWTLTQAVTNGAVNGTSEHEFPSAMSSSPGVKPALVFDVTLEQNDRVTPADHWQDVRFLKLKTGHDVEYYPGDAIAIRPKNMPEDVQELIKIMEWEDVADHLLHFRLNRSSKQQQRLTDPTLSASQQVTLRQLLTDNLDINAIPRRSFFAAIANYTDNEMHKERLQEFTDPQYLDEYYDYATRPRRSILEILQEFASVKIPWQEAINVFPILRPRQFSIASGGFLKEGGKTFELLVAIVKYRTVIKRIREGICSRYLAKLPVGTTLEVTLKTEGRFHKPEQYLSMRHLLIGAGTGIAPLRAVIHEKATPKLESTLIFGCRNTQADYFFRDEWQATTIGENNDRLRVITAFSRDQKQKVYVQDKIRENAAIVLEHLFDPNSTTIICGSSGPMPKAVRQAFVDVLCSELDGVAHRSMSTDEAELFLSRMEKDGRYKQETW